MDLKVKDKFTFVIIYTFSGASQIVADQFKGYLQLSARNDDLAAINIDQSTYATKIDLNAGQMLRRLNAKLNALYAENQLRRNPEDVVYVLCNSHRAFLHPTNPEDIYRFDVFDYMS